MTNLWGLSLTELKAFIEGLGEKPFKAGQIMRWVHQRGVIDFDAMSDLSKSLRDKLKAAATFTPLPMLSEHISADGTIKWLFDVGSAEGGSGATNATASNAAISNAIEAVYIPEADRGTLCVSSQAGCAVGCSFCSTGHQGFSRNLTTAEIVYQLWFAEHTQRRRRAAGAEMHFRPQQLADTKLDPREVTNVVMMGMGEPLQNYNALVPALRIMLDDFAYGISRRRLTVSTSGVVPMIERLGADCPVALAVSLHAPTNALRDELVPLNKKYPLQELLQACKSYLPQAPRDFLTLEYCMLDGVNDTPRHARELIDLLRGRSPEADVGRLPCKVNLIPFNPFPQSGLKRSAKHAVQNFAQILLGAGLIVTVRKTRGDDIDAACGQLAGQVADRTQVMKRFPQRYAAGAAGSAG